jgi:hypothetical protein
MIQFNETGQRDPDAFQRLNRSAEISRETSQRLANERAALWAQVNALQRQYLRDLIPEIKSISKLQIHVIVELRRELTVGGDVEVFALIMRRQLERMERAIDDFDSTFLANINAPDPASGAPPSGSAVPE